MYYQNVHIFISPQIYNAKQLVSIIKIVRRNIGPMAYRVGLEYRLFLTIDSSLYRPKTIFFRGFANFVHWHFFKSNMAAATPKYH